MPITRQQASTLPLEMETEQSLQRSEVCTNGCWEPGRVQQILGTGRGTPDPATSSPSMILPPENGVYDQWS